MDRPDPGVALIEMEEHQAGTDMAGTLTSGKK
jgi:hypothetical protein